MLEGDAFSNQSQDLPPAFRNGLLRLPAQFLDPLGHAPGGFQIIVIGIDEGAEGRRRFGLLIEFSIGGFVSLGAPLGDAFLEEPGPGDVAKEAGGALNTLFVGPADTEGLLGENGFCKLGAQNRPGARGEESVVALPGDSGDSCTGVVSGGCDDGEISADLLRYHFAQVPEDGAGFYHLTEDTPGKTQSLDDIPGPVLGEGGKELGGRGIRALHRDAPGEPEGKEVGDHEEVRGVAKSHAIPHRFPEELVGGIEEEGHDARLFVHCGIPIATLALLLHAISAGIAVLVGQSKQAALRVEEGEIHAPGVDPQGRDVLSVFFDRQPKTVENFAVKTEDVPDQAARKVRAGIVEAVNVLQLQGPQVRSRGQNASTACSQVNCEVYLLFHSFSMQSRGTGQAHHAPMPAIINRMSTMKKEDFHHVDNHQGEECPA